MDALLIELLPLDLLDPLLAAPRKMWTSDNEVRVTENKQPVPIPKVLLLPSIVV